MFNAARLCGPATAVLVAVLAVTSPAVAAPSAGPALHGGDSPGQQSTSEPHDGHDQAHDDAASTPTDEGKHGDHSDHSDHGDHGDHGDHVDHGDHGAHGDHGDHGDAATEHGDHGEAGGGDEETSPGHGAHGGGASGVSGATRVRVLGSFGAVNAAVVAGAFLLRRKDRRAGKRARNRRGSRR